MRPGKARRGYCQRPCRYDDHDFNNLSGLIESGQPQRSVLSGSWDCCGLWYLKGAILVHGVSFRGVAHCN